MDVHFMKTASQIIMLYALNIYSAVCQLYLNKTGRKKLCPQKINYKGKKSNFILEKTGRKSDQT